MARGWESKSIEDQQASAERSRDAGEALSAEEVERRQAADGLRLVRARVLADLQRACQPAHRGMLEQALADVEARLADLGRDDR